MKIKNAKTAAVSVLGRNRPGIVAAISKALFETGCNIEDSSMTTLREEFAMILLVKLAGGLSMDALLKKLRGTAAKLNLSVFLRELSLDEHKKSRSAGEPWVISVYGSDRPGIVYGLSNLLYEARINITDVQTKIIGPCSKPTYVMLVEIDLPGKNLKALRKKLDIMAKNLNVIINLRPAETPEL